MLQISAIYIYPVKSLGGVAVPAARTMPRGLEWDRRWMLVDAHGQFLTQRRLPVMAQIKVDLESDRLRFTAPRMEPLELTLGQESGPGRDAASRGRLQVQVWEDRVSACRVGPTYDAWFQTALGQPCRLVYMPDTTVRTVRAAPDHQVGFADSAPYLLVTEASLADLNQRLAARGSRPVEMRRFRPNLVLRGSAPYAEDRWRRLAVGQAGFRVVKPCSRCAVTTLDPDTGEGTGPEPLATLREYRAREGKVVFGQKLVQDEPGNGPVTLEVGQGVRLL